MEISMLAWILVIVTLIIVFWGIYITRAPIRGAPVTPATRTVNAPAKVDDLTIIEGIGPKIAQVLSSAGITTFDQLALTDENRLRTILSQGGVRLADPTSWPEQARLAGAGDMEGLKKLQDRLTAGRTA